MLICWLYSFVAVVLFFWYCSESILQNADLGQDWSCPDSEESSFKRNNSCSPKSGEKEIGQIKRNLEVLISDQIGSISAISICSITIISSFSSNRQESISIINKCILFFVFLQFVFSIELISRIESKDNN